MKTTENSNHKPILVKIADQLLKDQQELDLLAVQLALGKVEAKTEFEEAKLKLKKSTQNFKEKLSLEIEQSSDWANSVKIKLDNLDEQLDKGMAETKEVFKEQKKNILKGIEDVIIEIEKNPEILKLADFFTPASEKIKLQLEIFEKKMEAKTMELTDEYKDEMKNAHDKIKSIISMIKEKQEDASLKWENFKDEIHISYEHLKKAIQAL